MAERSRSSRSRGGRGGGFRISSDVQRKAVEVLELNARSPRAYPIATFLHDDDAMDSTMKSWISETVVGVFPLRAKGRSKHFSDIRQKFVRIKNLFHEQKLPYLFLPDAFLQRMSPHNDRTPVSVVSIRQGNTREAKNLVGELTSLARRENLLTRAPHFETTTVLEELLRKYGSKAVERWASEPCGARRPLLVRNCHRLIRSPSLRYRAGYFQNARLVILSRSPFELDSPAGEMAAYCQEHNIPYLFLPDHEAVGKVTSVLSYNATNPNSWGPCPTAALCPFDELHDGPWMEEVVAAVKSCTPSDKNPSKVSDSSGLSVAVVWNSYGIDEEVDDEEEEEEQEGDNMSASTDDKEAQVERKDRTLKPLPKGRVASTLSALPSSRWIPPERVSSPEKSEAQKSAYPTSRKRPSDLLDAIQRPLLIKENDDSERRQKHRKDPPSKRHHSSALASSQTGAPTVNTHQNLAPKHLPHKPSEEPGTLSIDSSSSFGAESRLFSALAVSRTCQHGAATVKLHRKLAPKDLPHQPSEEPGTLRIDSSSSHDTESRLFSAFAVSRTCQGRIPTVDLQGQLAPHDLPHQPSEEPRTMSIDTSSSDGSESRLVSTSIKECVSADFFATERLQHLWQSCSEETFSIFLPYLHSPRVFMRTLCVASTETLALGFEDSTGISRRRSLWNTCLDVKLMEKSLELELERHSGSAPLSQPEPNEWRSGLKEEVDPSVPLCPNELVGVCDDPSCRYQHFERRSCTEVCEAAGKSIEDERQNHRSSNASQHMKDHQDNVQDVSKPVHSKVHYLDDLDSLLAEPEPAPDPDRIDDAFISQWERLTVAGVRASNGARRSGESDSIPQIVERHGNFRVQLTSAKTTLRIDDGNLPRTENDAYESLQDIVDCSRIAIHAGRFDISHALCLEADEVANALGSACNNPRECMCSAVIAKIVQLLKEVESRAFVLGNPHESSPFRCSFNSQITLSILSIVVTEFHDMTRNGSNHPVKEGATRDFLAVLEALRVAFGDVMASDDVSSQVDCQSIQDGRAFQVSGGTGTALAVENESLRRRVVPLLDAIRTGRAIDSVVSGSDSITSVVDDVLEPCMMFAAKELSRAFDDSRSTALLKVAILLGHSVMGMLTRLANRYSSYELSVAEGELSSAFDSINSALCKVLRLSECIHLAGLVVVPLLAANIALGASTCKYADVNSLIERLLSKSPRGGKKGTNIRLPPMAPYSEMLLSQLMQLKASLVLDMDVQPHPDLRHFTSCANVIPEKLVNDYLRISKISTFRGVWPRHFTMGNEGSLTSAVARKGDSMDENPSWSAGSVEASLLLLLQNLDQNTGNSRSDRRLSLARVPLSSGPSGLPPVILAAGRNLVQLSLSATSLNRLPMLFGTYFPELERLDLSDNKLTELPDSISAIFNLQVLIIRGNLLSLLPQRFSLPRLTELFASENRLSTLPNVFFEKSSKLRVLDLTDNPLDHSVWSRASKLPGLTKMSPRAPPIKSSDML